MSTVYYGRTDGLPICTDCVWRSPTYGMKCAAGKPGSTGAPMSCELYRHRRAEVEARIGGQGMSDQKPTDAEVIIWMAEHLMGSSVAMTMRGWLARFRAEGGLVVRDAAGVEIAHYPEEVAR